MKMEKHISYNKNPKESLPLCHANRARCCSPTGSVGIGSGAGSSAEGRGQGDRGKGDVSGNFKKTFLGMALQ